MPAGKAIEIQTGKQTGISSQVAKQVVHSSCDSLAVAKEASHGMSIQGSVGFGPQSLEKAESKRE